MEYKKLVKNVKHKIINPVNILYGNEVYYIDNIIKKIENVYVDSSLKDLNCVKIDLNNDSIDKLLESISTVPFMSEKKIIIVENCDFLTSSSSNKFLEDKLLDIGNDIETVIILFVLRNNKPDTRKKYVKRVKEFKGLLEIDRLSEGDITNYVISRFKNKNLKISVKDAAYFAQNSGYLEKDSKLNLYNINNEINKISSYCIDREQVNKRDIDILMVKSLDSNIFRFIDFVCESKAREAKIMLNDMLLKGAAEQYIIYMVIRQIRQINLFLILSKRGLDSSSIINIMKVPRFIVTKLSKISSNINECKIEKLLKITIDVDRKIKKGNLNSKVGLDVICNSF